MTRSAPCRLAALMLAAWVHAAPATAASAAVDASIAAPILIAAGSPAAIAVPGESAHRDGDDLLTAGLGIDGLRGPIPALADANAPTFAELRRRAVWTNWRGIADVAPGGGLGEVYGKLSPVPGREFHGSATVPDATHPHRLLLQLPDAFDRERPCLVVTASSGSRGIYGAIALAGGWGLPRGCAVAYTDKGAGTDWRRVINEDGITTDIVHVPHAHSGDHPEADWGRHVLQAAAFGRDVLVRETGIEDDALTVIAAGLSNGAGAVLRAAGDEADGLRRIDNAPGFDGVVAVAPNVHVDGVPALFDVAAEAAQTMPCALVAAGVGPQATPVAASGDCHPDAAAEALAALRAAGWTDVALRAGALSVGFDLWRAVLAGYASSYARADADSMPGGYRYAVRDVQGETPDATATEAALWWSDSSGIPPGSGVMLLDPPGDDGRVRGLFALREFGREPAVRDAIAATRALPPREDLPILLLHGLDDGLVPEWTTSARYAAFARGHGATLAYWRVAHAQHFDAFLGNPALAARYVPLMPYAYAALDAMWAHLHDGVALPDDLDITPTPRAAGTEGPAPLRASDLALPH